MYLKKIGRGLVHLFYPRLCEGCRAPLIRNEEVLCMACNLELPKTRYHNVADNDSAFRFAGRIPFQHVTSFAYFTNEGLLQHLLHGLKYAGKTDIGIFLGSQFGQDLKSAEWVKSVDIIIPVPLHPKKEAARGYNQSTIIAEAMSEELSIPFSSSFLKRVRHTESQTQKTRAERLDNMKAAFEIRPGSKLEGKHVLLLDDVLTTGATLEACALELLTIKDLKVSICTVGVAL